MGKQQKYYVVWEGREKGIFRTWEDCKKSVLGYPNARYKSFVSLAEAEEAFQSMTPRLFYSQKRTSSVSEKKNVPKGDIPLSGLAVDAACSGNPGLMEYRGVMIETGEQVFFYGPYQHGTNNIGEFLAIVDGLRYVKENNLNTPIYSDSRVGMLWVKNKKCNTKMSDENRSLFERIKEAEKWLSQNEWSIQILKWETKEWGEIPADFGNK